MLYNSETIGGCTTLPSLDQQNVCSNSVVKGMIMNMLKFASSMTPNLVMKMMRVWQNTLSGYTEKECLSSKHLWSSEWFISFDLTSLLLDTFVSE